MTGLLLEIDATAMQPGMLGLRHHLKVLRTIVAAITIQVMHDLIRLQVSAQHPLCNEAMFRNVSGCAGIGVIRNLDVDVAHPLYQKPRNNAEKGGTPWAFLFVA